VKASVFEATASEVWRWSLATDEAGVLERVRSVSYVAAMPEDGQQKVDERVRDILREHGVNSSGRPIEFPYVTEAYVLRRRRRWPTRSPVRVIPERSASRATCWEL
jgi:hypothetical protein